MPIYEYRCQSCGDTFEVLTSYSDREAAKACPMCSSERTNVQVSSFAAVGASGPELPMAASAPRPAGGGCCGGACGCGH